MIAPDTKLSCLFCFIKPIGIGFWIFESKTPPEVKTFLLYSTFGIKKGGGVANESGVVTEEPH